jgi:hypothetical protein
MKKEKIALCGMLVALVVGLLVVGCNNIHDIDLTGNEKAIPFSRQEILALSHLEESHEVSENDLQNRLSEFLKSESVSRNAEGTESVIVGSKKYITKIEKGFSSKTSNSRSADDPDVPSDIPFYVFDLKNEQKGTEGYAITCGDSRIGDIIAVVDDGSLEGDPTPFDLIFCANMESYIDNTVEEYNSVTDDDIQVALTKLANEADIEILEGVPVDSNRVADRTVVYVGLSSKPGYVDTPFNPLTEKTRWNQRYGPYNSVITAYYGYASDVPAGCVPVAMAQMMAYHEWPAGFQSDLASPFKDPYTKATRYLRNIRYNWSEMKKQNYAYNLTNNDAKTQVGALLLDAGKAVKVTYNSSGSGAYPEDVPAAFVSMKYNVPNGIMSYNFSTVQSSIDNKRPVFINGNDGYYTVSGYRKYFLWFKWDYYEYNVYTGGHAWVIDDYRIKKDFYNLLLVYSDGTTQEYLLDLPVATSSPQNQVHCNIGWGSTVTNGWYVSGIFNTKTGVIEKDRSVSDEKNYAYNIRIIPNIYPRK